jgi:protein TonB
MIINKTLTITVALLGHATLLYGLTTMSDSPKKPGQVVMLLAPAPMPMGEEVSPLPLAKPRALTPPSKPTPVRPITPAVAKKISPSEAPVQQATGKMDAAVDAAAPAPAAPAESATAVAGSQLGKQVADDVPVTPPLFNTTYLANPRPAYPSQSMALGEKGRVMLRVKVSESGLPLEIELAHSSGYRRLDDAAKKAVERWKFVPGRRGDTAIVMSAMVPVDFVI